MANYVKVATFGFSPVKLTEKPEGMSNIDYEIAYLDSKIKPVLAEKPDLIVLPEYCDCPMDIPQDEKVKYYKEERLDKAFKYLSGIARENNCYIAYSTWVEVDGYGRNALRMIDRKGNILGEYYKNYMVTSEPEFYNCKTGKDTKIFDCDFGRVGGLICFDLNFEELRLRYKALRPDLMLFSANFGGGIMQNYFAYDTKSYFVGACAYNHITQVVDPLGNTIAKKSVYSDSLVETIDLDYVVVHLDYNEEKFAKAKAKYGANLIIDPKGDTGQVIITYKGTDTTARAIVKEFEIPDIFEYLKFGADYRMTHLEK